MKTEQQNFIGKTIYINGKKEIVQNETKNTIITKNKTYPKETITIIINNKTINGKTITKTPAERIKGNKK